MSSTATDARMAMPCMGEDEWSTSGPPVRPFAPDGNGEYVCTYCGWIQGSETGGADELCRSATWHSLDAYRAMAARARAGGLAPPADPPYFEPAAASAAAAPPPASPAARA